MFNKKSQKDDFFSDDCPICQAVKKAEQESRQMTMKEIKKVFQKAKKQGMMVGGEWFENDK